MTFQFDGYNYLVRLEKGELLVESLLQFAKEQKISGGWISAVGGALSAEIGFYDLAAQHYIWKKLDTLLEIASLQGNLAWDASEPVLHLHGSLSDKTLQTYSGHIKEIEVGGTCEIFVHVWNKDELSRTLDDQTGLNLLDL
jgi:uncharacterized protein